MSRHATIIPKSSTNSDEQAWPKRDISLRRLPKAFGESKTLHRKNEMDPAVWFSVDWMLTKKK
jgi:hypothetical protein